MKTYLLLLPLFLLTTTLSAQEVVLFDDTQEQTLVYRYSQLSGPSAPALQQILRLLQPQNTQQAALDVHYRYQLRILEGSNSLKNCIQWEVLQTERAPSPYGFTFEDLLQPNGATFNLELLADGEVVATKCVQQNFGTNLPAYTFDFTELEGGVYYTLRVNDLTFNYGSRHIQAVQQRVRAIDQYLISKDKLIALKHSLEAFHQLSPLPQQLGSYGQQLRNYENQLQRICAEPFWNILQLDAPNAHDPEQLNASVSACKDEVHAWQHWLDGLVATVHILYFEQGVAAYQDGHLRAAREAFQASLRTSDCYAPSHYFIAYLDFEQGHIEEAAQRVRRVLNRYNPDPNTRTDANRLASGIVRFYLDAGQHEVALRRYPAGVAHYEQALAFSESIRGFDFGQAEARSRMQEAYQLDFHDQLDQVAHTHQTGQYQLALTQLDEALKFQQTFRVNSTADTRKLASVIVNDLHDEQLTQIRAYRYEQQWDQGLSAVAVAEDLLRAYPGMVREPQQLAKEKQQILMGKYQGMVAQAEELLQNQRLDQALAQAEKGQQFVYDYALGLSQERESQRLIEKVQQLRYERFVRGGDRAKRDGQYGSALEQYEQAQVLEGKVTLLQTAAELPQKLSSTALLEANRLLQEVLQRAADDNSQLERTQAQIQALAGRFQIGHEPQLTGIIQQLKQQQCTNARDLLLPQQEQQLAQQQTARDYIAARATLDNIAQLLQKYPDCGLDESSLVMNERIVTACATYQEQLQSAERAEQQLQFAEAIEYYAAAKNSYADGSVQARLATHPALRLYEYITSHENYRMVLAGGHYYLDQRQHEQSLELLQLMVDRGIDPRATEGLQQRLGSALAVRHYVASANWKTTFYGFVAKEERKPYKELYRAFRKQWKRMA